MIHHIYFVCKIIYFLQTHTTDQKVKYSQTCIKRSHLGPRKRGLIRQVTSEKRLNSYKIFYDRTRKR
jgi:hypothetical protein